MKKNRFDLEQEIMDCWHVVDDLDMLVDGIEDISESDVITIIKGMKELYNLKFNRLFGTFEQCVQTGQLDTGTSFAQWDPNENVLEAYRRNLREDS